MKRVVLISSAPGRAGADALIRALGAHPSVSVSPCGPPVLTSLHELAIYGDDSADRYLPRRAAQALTDTLDRLQQCGPHGHDVAEGLLRSTAARSVDIPVYGELWLPTPRKRDSWLQLARDMIVELDPDPGNVTLVKAGFAMSRGLNRILKADDLHVSMVRHPVTLVETLTDSRVDSMRLDEAIALVEQAALGTGEGSHHCNSIMEVRLEDLCADPFRVLALVAERLGLDESYEWMSHAARTLPSDIRIPDLRRSPRVGGYSPPQSVLAAWGYA